MQTQGKQRGFWGSRLGFILAASGSAVGLGNIWKFPYITGENGGGAFVMIYLVCILIVGLPIMLCEFTIGRRTNLNPVGAFNMLKPGTPWVLVGYMGVLAGFLILSFYGVVGGWTLAYVVKSVTHVVDHFASSAEAGAFFGQFIANTGEIMVYHTLFMALCMAIVYRGVHGGIERACDILMPTLVIMLFLLMIRALTLPGAEEGVKFYLYPDFSKITGQTVLLAMGQAFFSLSLGMGCLITYGSYLSPKENLTSCTFYVVLFDTMIALLVGMVIFPAVFAMGLEPESGPSLVFNVLPAVFSSMPFGTLVSIVFFALLTIAAITSAISLLESVSAYFIDQRGWPRQKAVIVTGVVIYLFGIPSGLSFGVMQDVTFFGMTFFDVVDNLSSNYLLPLGGMLTAAFVGWVWGTKEAHREIERHETTFHWARYWEFVLKYVSPVAVAIVFITHFLPAD
ncbi:SNF family sodium-dependent transporter [Nitrospina gracilis 3/211]|uniref:Transporter n=1 Tax=Nitrospina gracilis (strain 3/211) TaxID=1266370 RepID=M1YVA5_NITG3|nr:MULTISPECIES: sodium-dependent transporter [Nitrospina]MCF8722608.1 NSS family neurotransmitter:Na+ symporter [Nitrospina sp. Nb-3]CCQ89537.1 SNF family sodium-dependent transporter [Nitrospina gracilis 3/211]